MADSVTFSLKYPARALAPFPNSSNRSQWVVGTNSLREENEIRIVEYDTDQEALRSVASFTHEQEVWDVAASPSGSHVATVHSKVGAFGATLWALNGEGQPLQEAAQLPGHEGVIRRVLWHQQQQDTLLTIEEGAMHTWKLTATGAESVAKLSPGDLQQLWSGTLHHSKPELACMAAGNNLQLWDVRAGTKVGEIPGAHKMPVRDVDFSPQQEHRLVSAGDDCKLRFWDTRVLGRTEALAELGGHSHWVWQARYNPQHDQLLASCSSDGLVALWYTPVLARSAEYRSDGSRPVTSPATPMRNEADGRVHAYDEHEDSTYCVAWSTSDPWAFASLSYDGRMVVNKVPKNIKYKVLI